MKSYLITVSIFLSCLLHAKHHARPNIIFVLADDLGIGDVSPTNPDCKIKTPHLQKMGACEIPRQNFLAKLKNSLSNKPANLDWNKII